MTPKRTDLPSHSGSSTPLIGMLEQTLMPQSGKVDKCISQLRSIAIKMMSWQNGITFHQSGKSVKQVSSAFLRLERNALDSGSIIFNGHLGCLHGGVPITTHLTHCSSSVILGVTCNTMQCIKLVSKIQHNRQPSRDSELRAVRCERRTRRRTSPPSPVTSTGPLRLG